MSFPQNHCNAIIVGDLNSKPACREIMRTWNGYITEQRVHQAFQFAGNLANGISLIICELKMSPLSASGLANVIIRNYGMTQVAFVVYSGTRPDETEIARFTGVNVQFVIGELTVDSLRTAIDIVLRNTVATPA